MQNGFYSAAGGMATQFNRLFVVSNNLANVNTNGFKRDDVVIGDYKRLHEQQREELPLQNNTKDAAKFLNRSLNETPHIVQEYTNYSIGGLQKTGNDLDFALTGPNTFFAVETPSGVRYTRDGSFRMNADGRLETKEGYPVLPSNYFASKGTIAIPQDAEVTGDKNGGLHYKLPGQQQNQEADETLLIVRFDNLQKLQKEGSNLFSTNEEPIVGPQQGVMIQGFVEKSNINPVNEMVALIETNRLVGMYQKAMDSQMNDMNNEAINKLAARA